VATWTKDTGTKSELKLAVSYSQSGNKTTFTIKPDVYSGDGATWANSIKFTIKGAGKTWTKTIAVTSGSGWYDLGTYTVTVTHGSDGKLGSQAFSLAMPSTGTSGLGGPTTVSGSITPPRIPVAPSAVRSVSATGQSNGTSIYVTYAKPSDDGGSSIDEYHIHASRYSNFSSYKAVNTGTSLSGTVSGLDKGALYYVRVIAHSTKGGWNTSTASHDIDTVTLSDVPGAPGKPSLSSPSAGALVIDWDAPSSNGGQAISGYNIRYRIDGGSWQSTTDTVPPRGPITGLKPGGSCDVQVQAKNSVGAGAWSPVATITLKAGKPGTPGKPTVTSPSLGTVKVTWSAPSDNGGKSLSYNIRYQIDGGAWTTKSNVTSGVTFTVTGGAVNVQVQAKNADATGDWSASGSIAVVSGALTVRVGSSWTQKASRAYTSKTASKVVPIKIYSGGSWKLLD